MYTVDIGEQVFQTQQDANTFCRSNPHFVPTSLHRNWMGKIKCRYCKSSGWLKGIGTGIHWANKHGANCKKKPYWSSPISFVSNQNFYWQSTGNGGYNIGNMYITGPGTLWINTSPSTIQYNVIKNRF